MRGRVASITGQARSTLTRENGQPTDSNLAQPSSVILLRARTPICASSFLIFEPPRSQFRPDHTFPTTNLCFRATALIVAASDLPCQSAVRLYLAMCWSRRDGSSRDFRARTARFWRWNDDLDCIAKTRREQISGRGAVIGPIRQKSRNRPVELIQKPGQGRAIADVGSSVRSEQMISPVVRSRPRCSFLHDLRLAFVSCLTCSHSPSPKIFNPVLSMVRWIGSVLSTRGFAGNLKPSPRATVLRNPAPECLLPSAERCCASALGSGAAVVCNRTQSQAGLDRNVRIFRLTSRSRPARRSPLFQRIVSDPDGQIATTPQDFGVLRPICHPISFLRKLVATSSVEFMRHSSVQIRGGAPDYQNYLCSCNNVHPLPVLKPQELPKRQGIRATPLQTAL